jgi:hypothetical protein
VGRKRPKPVTRPAKLHREKVEEMFTLYAQQQSANYVAQNSGVSWSTANKYIVQGDPQRGIEPFRMRYLAISKEVTTAVDHAISYGQKKQLRASLLHLQLFDAVILQAIEQVQRKLKDQNIKLTDLAKALAARAQLVRSISEQQPRAERTEERTEIRAVLGDLDLEQLAAMAEHGKIPDDYAVEETTAQHPTATHPHSKPPPTAIQSHLILQRHSESRHAQALDAYFEEVLHDGLDHLDDTPSTPVHESKHPTTAQRSDLAQKPVPPTSAENSPQPPTPAPTPSQSHTEETRPPVHPGRHHGDGQNATQEQAQESHGELTKDTDASKPTAGLNQMADQGRDDRKDGMDGNVRGGEKFGERGLGGKSAPAELPAPGLAPGDGPALAQGPQDGSQGGEGPQGTPGPAEGETPSQGPPESPDAYEALRGLFGVE